MYSNQRKMYLWYANLSYHDEIKVLVTPYSTKNAIKFCNEAWYYVSTTG